MKVIKLKLITLLLTTIWIGILALRFFSDYDASGTKNFTPRLNGLINKYLILTFYPWEKFQEGPDLKSSLIYNVLWLQDKLYEDPRLSGLYLFKKALLYGELGRSDTALKLLRKAAKGFNPEITEAMLWSYDTNAGPITQTQARYLFHKLQSELEGWYQIVALKQFCSRLRYPWALDYASQLKENATKSAEHTFKLLLGLLLGLSLGFLMGIALLLILPLVLPDKIFCALNTSSFILWDIFLCFELLRFFFFSVYFFINPTESLLKILPLFLLYAGNMLIALILIKTYIVQDKIKDWACLGVTLEQVWKNLWLGVAGYFMALPVVLIFSLLNQKLFKADSFSTNPILEILTKSMPGYEQVLLYLVVAIMGPVLEEIVFRGILFQMFRKRFPPVMAVALSAFFFSFVHVDLPGFLPIFGLGLILGFLAEKTRSLIPSIITHALWNSVTFFFLTSLF